MLHISTYLEKFKNIIPSDSLVKETARTILSEENIIVEKKDISLSGNILYVKLFGPAKNELYILKSEIMRKLRDQLGKKAPRDIR